MRICCVIHSLDGGGAERVMAGLASDLAERGHEVTLITLDDCRNDRYPVAEAVTRVCLDVMAERRGPVTGVLAAARRAWKLRRAILRSRPETVLSFCDRTNVLTLTAMLGRSMPIIVSERSDPHAQQMPAPWAQLRRRLYRRAAAIVVLTPQAAETAASWSPRPPVVIPGAIRLPPPAEDGDEDEPARGDADRPQTVIGVGRLEAEKGFDRLIDAFARVAPLHPQWRLVIYGEGSLRTSLESRRDRLGLAERVEFPGWVNPPIWPVYRRAALFVLSSRYEGFPSALLEAMACGPACIAFDCPSGPGAIICHGEDGLLVPADDVEALAAAIERCIADPELRAALSRRAAQSVRRFSWPAMVDAYETLLQEVSDSAAVPQR